MHISMLSTFYKYFQVWNKLKLSSLLPHVMILSSGWLLSQHNTNISVCLDRQSLVCCCDDVIWMMENILINKFIKQFWIPVFMFVIVLMFKIPQTNRKWSLRNVLYIKRYMYSKIKWVTTSIRPTRNTLDTQPQMSFNDTLLEGQWMSHY